MASRVEPRRVEGVVLVTGGTGSLGPSVVHALRQAKHVVRVLADDAPEPGLLPDEVELSSGDIRDVETVRAAMKGVSRVVHMAALLHVENPSDDLAQRYADVNVSGTASVVAAAMAANVERLVYVSTIAVYGQAKGAVLSEATPPEPDSPYAKTKLDGERIVLGARRPDGAALGTVLRLAAIYGPRVKGHYRRLIRTIDRGFFVPFGPCTNRRTVVFHKDAAAATVLALLHGAAAGRIYNITDGAFHSTGEIIAAISAALGRKPPRLRLPVAPIRGMMKLLDSVAWVLPRRLPVSERTIDKFLEDIAVDGSLAQKELGFVPQYDLRSGWRETVAEIRLAALAGRSDR